MQRNHVIMVKLWDYSREPPGSRAGQRAAVRGQPRPVRGDVAAGASFPPCMAVWVNCRRLAFQMTTE